MRIASTDNSNSQMKQHNHGNLFIELHTVWCLPGLKEHNVTPEFLYSLTHTEENRSKKETVSFQVEYFPYWWPY